MRPGEVGPLSRAEGADQMSSFADDDVAGDNFLGDDDDVFDDYGSPKEPPPANGCSDEDRDESLVLNSGLQLGESLGDLRLSGASELQEEREKVASLMRLLDSDPAVVTIRKEELRQAEIQKAREERAAEKERLRAERAEEIRKAKLGPMFRAGPLSRQERLVLRKAALSQGRLGTFQVGKKHWNPHISPAPILAQSTVLAAALQ